MRLYISAIFLFLVNIVLSQCPSSIQTNNTNSNTTKVLTFYNSIGAVIGTCTCNVAGGSGNVNCPGCAYTIPSTSFANVSMDGCIYNNSGVSVPALSIELVEFDVYKYSLYNYIYWVCVGETNNDYFDLERSNDGINFNTIKILDGAGTTNVGTFYSYKDYSFIENSYNYYRLTQVDYNGDSESFNIISVDNNSSIKREIIRITNMLGIDVDYAKDSGIYIYYYSDNTYQKVCKIQ